MNEISSSSRYIDKVVVVTGSSRGIGKATAERFGAEGASVVVNHWGDSEEAAQTAGRVEQAGGRALVIEADVSDPDQVVAMFSKVSSEWHVPDIIVNNAGVASHVPFERLTYEEWRRIMSVNLDGVFNCCRAVVEDMVSRGAGTIINIASELGLVGAQNLVHYSASKGAVITMTKSLARELAPKGIRVNAVAPGPIETDMLTPYPDEYNDETLAQIPIGRWGQPQDVAGTVAFLASDDASFYAGWVLSPNGGVVM